MSHYFQQLLTSSGALAPRSAPTSRAIAPMAAPVADFSEEVEKIISSAEPSSVGFDATPAPPSPPRSSPGEPPAASASSDIREAGVLEITPLVSHPAPVASRVTHPAPVPVSVESSVTTSSVTFGSAEKSTASVIAANPPGPLPTSASDSTPPPPGLPTHDELMQHVMRWVAQNPLDLKPAALAAVTPPLPTQPAALVQPLAAGTAGNQLSATSRATESRANSSAALSRSPAPAVSLPGSAATRRPSPASMGINESTVEISIGTLQIQVEAPPTATPSRPARRPAPHGTRAPAAAPASSRPALDLNRLRRGFYL